MCSAPTPPTAYLRHIPTSKGEPLQDIKGKKGYPLGKEIMQNATEGTIKELTYLVASSWVGQGAGEGHFLHEGR